jgi:hypothetical protein
LVATNFLLLVSHARWLRLRSRIPLTDAVPTAEDKGKIILIGSLLLSYHWNKDRFSLLLLLLCLSCFKVEISGLTHHLLGLTLLFWCLFLGQFLLQTVLFRLFTLFQANRHVHCQLATQDMLELLANSEVHSDVFVVSGRSTCHKLLFQA